MADAYCSSCGNSMPPSAQFCGRCGAAAGHGASEWDATRTDVHSPYRPDTAPYAQYPPAQPGPPPASRRASAPMLIAVVALVVAVIVVAVTLFVVFTRDDQTPVAGATSSSTPSVSSAVPSATPSSPSTAPTLAQPETVTVTRSATLTPQSGGGAANEPVPVATDQLRSLFESGTPVSAGPYSIGSTVYFETPSGNIECGIFAGDDSLQCAIDRYDFDQPGPDCNNGALFTLDAYGNATYSGCLTRPFFSAANKLGYGASIVNGEFGCISRSVGVSCVDETTDTGFSLSRAEFVPVN